jgi:ribosomal protein S18 acetylase RimI-like enzyme
VTGDVTVTLVPMDAHEVGEFIAQSRASYISELRAVGVSESDAATNADAQLDAMFPDGQPGDENLLFLIADEGKPCGSLWLGPDPTGDAHQWWVWDIEVKPDFRRRGIARAAMQLAAEEVRSRGGTEIGLNVFGNNDAARTLYESLGYDVASVRMRKAL